MLRPSCPSLSRDEVSGDREVTCQGQVPGTGKTPDESTLPSLPSVPSLSLYSTMTY